MLVPGELEDLTVALHSSFSCYDGSTLLRTLSDARPAMRLVDRTAFDSFLFRRASEAGAVPLPGEAFLGLDRDGAVFAGGTRVRFDRLLGADGALSTVRRRIYGRPSGRFGLCLETFVPLAPAVLENHYPLGLQARFGLLPYGYGWVFPRPDDLCVGVGSFGRGVSAADVRKAMENLLARLDLSPRTPLGGALVPPSRGGVTPGAGRVLLAGDAAGLCDHVSGEGISHALESGLLAAEALLAGADSWNTDSRCVRQVKRSAFFRHLLYHPALRPLAMKKLRDGDRFQRIYWGITAGSLEYRALLQPNRAARASAT
jgi:flavin-dependent dehydrogenase